MIQVVNVENSVTMKGEIFEGTKKRATVNILCTCQIPLAIELLMQMVFMG